MLHLQSPGEIFFPSTTSVDIPRTQSSYQNCVLRIFHSVRILCPKRTIQKTYFCYQHSLKTIGEYKKHLTGSIGTESMNIKVKRKRLIYLNRHWLRQTSSTKCKGELELNTQSTGKLRTSITLTVSLEITHEFPIFCLFAANKIFTELYTQGQEPKHLDMFFHRWC